MNAADDDLLRPSLSKRQPTTAYSPRTLLMTSLFGGPVSGVVLIGVNASRLHRRPGDVLVLIVLAMAVAACQVALVVYASDVDAGLKSTIGTGSLRFVNQVLGIAVFGAGYWLHRDEQRSIDLQGMDRPNGWIGGAACAAFGFAVQSLLVFGIRTAGAD